MNQSPTCWAEALPRRIGQAEYIKHLQGKRLTARQRLNAACYRPMMKLIGSLMNKCGGEQHGLGCIVNVRLFSGKKTVTSSHLRQTFLPNKYYKVYYTSILCNFLSNRLTTSETRHNPSNYNSKSRHFFDSFCICGTQKSP